MDAHADAPSHSLSLLAAPRRQSLDVMTWKLGMQDEQMPYGRRRACGVEMELDLDDNDTNHIQNNAADDVRSKWMRRFVIALAMLLAFDVAFLAYSTALIIERVPDSYHNEHLRLLAGNLSQVFLVGGILMAQRPKPGIIRVGIIVCMIGTIATLAWSISLA
jgi:hypothetical protein